MSLKVLIIKHGSNGARSAHFSYANSLSKYDIFHMHIVMAKEHKKAYQKNEFEFQKVCQATDISKIIGEGESF